MGIVIGLDARRLEFAKDEIVIGRGSTADVSLPDAAQLAERHAVLRKVAGRWLIEAQQDGSLRVGTGRPTKVAWLTPGDVIHLTESGPVLTFDPTGAAESVLPVGEPVVELQPDDSGPIRLAAPIPPPVMSPVPPPDPEQIVIPPGLAAEFDLPDKPLPRSRSRMPEREQPFGDSSASVEPNNRWKSVALGAAFFFGIAAVISIMRQPANVVVTSPQPAVITPPFVNSSAPPVDETRKPGDATATAANMQQLATAVYLVLLSAPDRDQTYRLGTAWAVDKRRLVTSAAVGQGIEQLREQLPRITVRRGGDSTGIAITQVLIHPEYKRIAEEVAAAQAVLDELQAGLTEETAEEERAADPETQAKMTAAGETLMEALQRQLDFDLAVLEVDRDLPLTLKAISDTAGIRPGASVKLLGMPFPMDEFLVDPESLLAVTAVTGQVQAKVAGEDQAVRRWLVKFREAKPGDNWSGSAVVNARGEILGVYSRPTPPTTLLEDDYVPSTHEITTIDRLKDIR